jgi:hypothetical protein
MSPKYELLVIALTTDDLRNAICACLENIIGLKLPLKPPLADAIAIIKSPYIDMALN